MSLAEYVKTLKTSDGAIIIYPETMASAAFYVDKNNAEQMKGVVIREGENRNLTVQEKLDELIDKWEAAKFGDIEVDSLKINNQLLVTWQTGRIGIAPMDESITDYRLLIYSEYPEYVWDEEGNRTEIRRGKAYYASPEQIMGLARLDSTYLKLTGGKMTGNIELPDVDLTKDSHAVSKKYLGANLGRILSTYSTDTIDFNLQDTNFAEVENPANKLVTTSYIEEKVLSMIHVGNTAPTNTTNLAKGALWIDTGGTRNNYLRYWSGSEWLAVPVAWT